jgi:hypothetical protein
MSRESSCRCLICALERSLTVQIAEHPSHYRKFADSCLSLSAFPSPFDLIVHLHGCRNVMAGSSSADAILHEILPLAATDDADTTLRDLLLLAFIPTLHSTLRRVAGCYRSLSTDDIGQHLVASLLEIFGSREFCHRTSHIAFAIARFLKRNAFAWAERECRSAAPVTLEALPESLSTFNAPERIERAALLRHFLYRCYDRGLLTTEDLQLLTQFKLDASLDSEPHGAATVYSNADRQRMKRLLGKLRRIARTRAGQTHADVQRRLF